MYTRLSIIFFLFLGLVYLIIKPQEDWVFLAMMSFASAFAFGLVSLFFSQRFLGRLHGQKFLNFVKGSVLSMIGITWLGSWGLYSYSGYDSFNHFISSVLAAIILSMMFTRIGELIGFNLVFLLIFAAFMVTIFLGVVNEYFEYYGDLWWGTEMYGEVGQTDDTARDLIYDVFGTTLGSLGTYVYYLKKLSH